MPSPGALLAPMGAEEPAQAAPCQYPFPSRDGPGSTPGAGCCAWTRLRSSCSLHVAWHATSLVRSQPIPQRGTAVSRGMEQPSSQHAAAGPALRSRTLQHCGPAGFSRDASKGRNQISREESRHVLGYTEELSRQCQELGQLLGTAEGQRKIKQAAPKPGAVSHCPTPGAAETLQSFVCKPCGRAALPWHFLQLCFTPTDTKQPAWRAGMGEGPC